MLLYAVLSSLCPTIFVYLSPSILPLGLVITMTSQVVLSWLHETKCNNLFFFRFVGVARDADKL